MNPPLTQKRCRPCEGGVPKLTADEIDDLSSQTPLWEVSADRQTITRKWNVGQFMNGVAAIERLGNLAEQEQHHPDVHLTGYRHLTVVLTTHAIGGLSENDFILAAKIDALMEDR